MWLIGMKLCQQDKDENINSRNGRNLKFRSQQLLLGAKFFELAESLFGCMNRGESNIIMMNQAICLVIAAAARVDASSLEENDFDKGVQENVFESTKLQSGPILSVPTIIENALKIIRTLIGFEFSETLLLLRDICISLDLSARCKLLSPSELMEYIDMKQDELMEVNTEKLIQCAHIAEEDRHITVDVIRKLYTIALQVCMREYSNGSLIGYLFNKLIELSSTREGMLELVEQFVQLLGTQNTSNLRSMQVEDEGVNHILGIQIQDFNVEDIDNICARTYNTCLTLCSLDQYDSAFEFIRLALVIIMHASSTLRDEWLPRIKVISYFLFFYSISCGVIGIIRAY